MDTKQTHKRIGVWATVGTIVVVAVVVGFLARMNTANFKKTVVSNTLEHLQTIARTESQHIERRVLDTHDELRVLAENPKVKEALVNGWTDKGGPVVDSYNPEKLVYEHLMTNINSLYRLDNKGIIQSRFPWKKGKAGVDFSDKPGVRQVLKNHRPYISKLFKNDSGSKSFSICYPVFEEKQFVGILRAMIVLQTIDECLRDSDIGTKGYAWIIDDNGIVVSHPKLGYVGKNIITAMKEANPRCDWTELQSIVKRMVKGEKGVGFFCSTSPGDEKLEDTKKLVAFVPARMANKQWSLGIVMDYDEISSPVKVHSRNVTIGVALLMFILVGAGGWFYKIQKEKAKLITEARSAEKLRTLNERLEKETFALRKTESQLQKKIDEVEQARTKAVSVEEEVRQQQQNLKAIFDAAPVAMLMLDENATIKQVNGAAAKLVGKEPSQIINTLPGKGLNCIHYTDDAQGCGHSPACLECPIRNTVKTTLKTGESVHGVETQQTFLVKEEEVSLWLEISVEPMGLDNKRHAIMVISNITARKMAEKEKETIEAQFRQAQKMEAIGTLAGGIAHDFNNILAAMIGYADLALEDIPQANPARSSLEQVLIAGSRAKELVKQILTFSRKTEQEQKPIEIAPIVQEALKMLRSSVPVTIEIREKIEATYSVIQANPTQIHQIIMNLCSNAAQSMGEERGLLEVSLTDIDIEAPVFTHFGNLQAGKYLKLTIRDTGTGIDSKIMSRIFEPFFTTKGVDKGTGMGLSVVHGIIESYGGVITVESELGKGTTFDVFFPRIESDQVQRKHSSEIVCGQGELILLIDDEKPIVDMMTQILSRLGYSAVGKTSGIEALEIFRDDPTKFDLVITDYAMPDMTGKELTKELINIRPDIPVILCTGFSEDIDSEETRRMGIREFVMKPVAKEKIAKVIQKVLGKRQVTV